eukprot:Anaeramoba_flamelloidesa576107_38.p1 GENE.a576107_38~~a576107_38.p1  ORF type:complete len:233 (-),score=55.33 a576107_38:9-707(-)
MSSELDEDFNFFSLEEPNFSMTHSSTTFSNFSETDSDDHISNRHFSARSRQTRLESQTEDESDDKTDSSSITPNELKKPNVSDEEKTFDNPQESNEYASKNDLIGNGPVSPSIVSNFDSSPSTFTSIKSSTNLKLVYKEKEDPKLLPIYSIFDENIYSKEESNELQKQLWNVQLRESNKFKICFVFGYEGKKVIPLCLQQIRKTISKLFQSLKKNNFSLNLNIGIILYKSSK